MSEIEYIDAKEFRETGYLQEVNRQFFHPHGLALSITLVDEGGWKADNEMVGQFADALADVCSLDPDEAHALAMSLVTKLYPPGSEFIEGVWDYRGDPEGILFDFPVWADPTATRTKALAVQAERAAHREERTRILDQIYGASPRAGGSDIEPFLWRHEDQ